MLRMLLSDGTNVNQNVGQRGLVLVVKKICAE